MFSHSHREEIWLLRAILTWKMLSHSLTTRAELSDKKINGGIDSLVVYLQASLEKK